MKLALLLSALLFSFVGQAGTWFHVPEAPFSPLNLSTIKGGWDPRTVVKDGSNRVSSWLDTSTNGNDFSQSSTANKFTYTANIFGTLPGLRSDGSSACQYMLLPTPITGLTSFSLFILYKTTDSIPTFNYLFDSSGFSRLFTLNDSSSSSTAIPGNASQSHFDTGLSVGSVYLFELESGTGPSTTTLKMNGVSKNQSLVSGSSWAPGLEIDQIGGLVALNRCSNGYFGPVFLFSPAISGANAAKVITWYHTQGFN